MTLTSVNSDQDHIWALLFKGEQVFAFTQKKSNAEPVMDNCQVPVQIEYVFSFE